jgi:biopolymer transport protein ExbD
MLIMFIVVAPILELDQVSLAQGKGRNIEAKNVQQNSPITLHVRADNSIWIDQHQIAPERLTEWFMEAKKRYPEIIPQLFHDKRAHFGTYQTIKNAAESAGFEQLQVILEPL